MKRILIRTNRQHYFALCFKIPDIDYAQNTNKIITKFNNIVISCATHSIPKHIIILRKKNRSMVDQRMRNIRKNLKKYLKIFISSTKDKILYLYFSMNKNIEEN